MADFPVYDRAAVEAALDYPGCIVAVRDAMVRFSRDAADQPLRQILEVAPDRLFALMPGMLGAGSGFGTKIVTVFPDGARPGRAAHCGIVALFDPDTGAVRAIGDAGAITEIRTACATAVATDALARTDATTLGLFGCGAQATTHLKAIALVRPIERVFVWGRDPARTAAFATQAAATSGLRVDAASDPRDAARADIVTTVTSSATPVLYGEWIFPGAHVNLVGSSYAGPVEVDTPLVARSRYIVDSRRAALVAAAEFLVARDAGAIDDHHILAEIGAVVADPTLGRQTPGDVTVYKSLGHIIQDLAAIQYLHDRLSRGV